MAHQQDNMLHETTETLSEKEQQQDFVRVSLVSLASDVFPDSQRGRLITAGVAIVVALLSFFVIGAWASSPETYADTIASLDAKRDTVMGLVGGSTGTSAAITLLPGDVGTPIAEKLLDIGSDFAIVIGAIYLEKYLLTVMGFAAFKVLVPIACLMVLVSALLTGRGLRYRMMFLEGATRLALFGIAIALVVPASVLVADAIDAAHRESTEAVLATAEEAASSAASVASEGSASDDVATVGSSSAGAETEGNAADEGGGFNLIEFVESIPSGVSGAAEQATAQAQETLNSFIETLAVMIVTSCVIPVLVLLFFLWLAKTILGVNVNVPVQAFAPRALRGVRR